MFQKRQFKGHSVTMGSLSIQQESAQSVIDTSGLLFKPFKTPLLSEMPELLDVFSHDADDFSFDEISDLPTVHMERAHAPGIPHLLSENAVIATGTFQFVRAPGARAVRAPYAGTLNSPLPHRSSSRCRKSLPGTVAQLIGFALVAGAVVTIYIVTPLTITLIPFLSNSGSRLLIAVTALAAAELFISRILLKTTRHQ